MRLKTNTKAEHGAAMVELVVLMLIFVPLVMLPLYFQDAIRYKLDAQEAVYSTAWDFAYGNYESKSFGDLHETIEQKNEEIFRNLWSGNKNDKQDPAGPWANFEWSGNASQPVTCEADTAFMEPSIGALLARSFHNSEYGKKGGFIECKGNIKVENHYIPQFFMTEFTGNNDKEMFLEQDQFMEFLEGGEPYKFGIMVDPWCIHNPDKIEKDAQGNPAFKDRVAYVYRKAIPSLITFEHFELRFAAWALKLVNKKITLPIGLAVGLIDYPPGLPTDTVDFTSLHFPDTTKEIKGRLSGNIEFWVSPFKDGDDNMYEKTFKAREQFYLGCNKLEPNCTN
ncbi:MAG: hypothetical protein JRJ87_07055 [Deltaproteobacteria bacterium]|nr:hypothetical protein [Deltaproteobacteria bacterium]